ncbi:MAG: YcjF family protein [Methylococcales bacterium]
MAKVAQQPAPESEPDESNTTEPASTTVQANKLVRNYALGSILVGVLPFPAIDLAALTAVQLTMLHGLAKVYDVEFSKQLGKSLIASLVGGGVSVSVAASLVKIIPVYGTATGIISTSVFGSASTYAIGKVFIQHFESGGTFLDFDPERVREYYVSRFEEGKQQLKKGVAGEQP